VPRKQEAFSHIEEPTMSAKKSEPTNDPILAEFRETMYKLYYPEGLSDNGRLIFLRRAKPPHREGNLRDRHAGSQRERLPQRKLANP
jgi:hypothetical protein